ncbi:MAG: DUF4344 domain-containing metallopeptidase [Sulfitobacter sp.]
MRATVTLLALAATPVQSEEATDPFVEANLLSIFYHELGHALIDVMHLPVFGQEEDAADTASILLIDSTFEDETAIEIAYGAALGFQAEAGETANDIAWSDVHGPDLQRFYNLVCLFYGADPDNFMGQTPTTAMILPMTWVYQPIAQKVAWMNSISQTIVGDL